jgi:hypothetical protein
MRKDVECTFGILKGRWRILKTGVRIQGTAGCDAIWKTCCALHNWLLEADGLDSNWENGVQQSAYCGPLGQFDPADPASQTAFAAYRLQNPAAARNFDLSGMSPGDDAFTTAQEEQEEEAPTEEAESEEGEAPSGETGTATRVVRKLKLSYFRERLIEHFDILWRQQKIVWPRRHRSLVPSFSRQQS